jgi:hypothetical protein
MILTKTGSYRGADMGRGQEEINRPHPDGEVTRCNLIPIGIDEQGYDAGGTYWGTPSDLWCLLNVEDGDYAEGEIIKCYLRSKDRPEALAWAAKHAQGEIEIVPYTGGFDVDEMLDGYMDAALWASGGDGPFPVKGGEPVENLDSAYNSSDIDDETRAWMRADVEKFLEDNREDVLRYMETRSLSHCGHDFWLSRTGSGTGFQDRGMGRLGRHLDVAAEKFSEHIGLWIDETTWKIRHE